MENSLITRAEISTEVSVECSAILDLSWKDPERGDVTKKETTRCTGRGTQHDAKVRSLYKLVILITIIYFYLRSNFSESPAR